MSNQFKSPIQGLIDGLLGSEPKSNLSYEGNPLGDPESVPGDNFVKRNWKLILGGILVSIVLYKTYQKGRNSR